jgi:hypothetical protein
MKTVAVVVLILVSGCVGLILLQGALLGRTEFLSPQNGAQQAYADGTKSAMEANATQAVWSATQTPQVAFVQAAQTQAALPIQATQTSQAIHDRATQIAYQATTTIDAAYAALEQKGLAATQAAIDANIYMDGQVHQATLIALNQTKEQDANRTHSEQVAATYNQVLQVLLIVLVSLVTTLLTIYGIRKLRQGKAEASLEFKRNILRS